jgi:hypothetical protein
MRTVFLKIIIALFTGFVAHTQPDDYKAGKCYAKCTQPNKEQTRQYFVYTGDTTFTDLPLKKHSVKIGRNSAFVLTRKNNNHSHWDSLLMKETELNFIALEDTLLSKEFKIMKVAHKISTENRDDLVWVEVVCEMNVTKSLLVNVQKALSAKGYYKGEFNGKMEKELKQAILQYQRDYDLHVGPMSIEFLRNLGLY